MDVVLRYAARNLGSSILTEFASNSGYLLTVYPFVLIRNHGDANV